MCILFAVNVCFVCCICVCFFCCICVYFVCCIDVCVVCGRFMFLCSLFVLYLLCRCAVGSVYVVFLLCLATDFFICCMFYCREDPSDQLRRCLVRFEQAYLSRSLSRLFDRINLLFPEGSLSPPTTQEVEDVVKTINRSVTCHYIFVLVTFPEIY